MKLQCLDTVNKMDWQELNAIYKKTLGEKDLNVLKTTFKNSMFKCFLYDSDILIGAGRALADGGDCSYLCDIVVLPEYQGRGLGKKIVSYLLEKSKDYNKVILYTFPEKENFYQQLGFTKLQTAMVIFKNSEKARKNGMIL